MPRPPTICILFLPFTCYQLGNLFSRVRFLSCLYFFGNSRWTIRVYMYIDITKILDQILRYLFLALVIVSRRIGIECTENACIYLRFMTLMKRYILRSKESLEFVEFQDSYSNPCLLSLLFSPQTFRRWNNSGGGINPRGAYIIPLFTIVDLDDPSLIFSSSTLCPSTNSR